MSNGRMKGCLTIILYVFIASLLIMATVSSLGLYGIAIAIIGAVFSFYSPKFRRWLYRQPGFIHRLYKLPGLGSSGPTTMVVAILVYLIPLSFLCWFLLLGIFSDMGTTFMVVVMGLVGIVILYGWFISGWRLPVGKQEVVQKTRPGEEDFLLNVFQSVRKNRQAVSLLIFSLFSPLLCGGVGMLASPLLAPEVDIASAPSPTNTPVVILEDTHVPTETYPPSETAVISQPPTATIEEMGTALVVQVMDGDTIKVLIGDVLWDLRYIGIDAPEDGQPYSSEALNANTQLVGGQTILLEKDISETDRYGRLLRYVFLLNGTFVNAELVRLGFAEVKAYPPDVKYHEQIFEHQLEAKENGLGIWAELAIAATATEPALSATSTEPAEIATATQSEEVANVIILDIFYDGVVPRVESDEYAIVKNVGASQVNMNGWRLNAGAPGQNFYFPDIIIQPGKTCRVYTNEYHPEYCGLSFNSSSAIWNNQGDCGYLFNAKGEQVSQYCY